MLAVVLAISLGGCRKKNEEEPEKEVKTVEREFVYESADEKGTEGIPKTITVDGKTYELVDLNDAVFSTLEVKNVVEAIREVILADLNELEEEYAFDINGRAYTLPVYEKYLEEKEIELTRTSTVTYRKITGMLSADDISRTVEIPVIKDGVEQNMEAELTEIKKTVNDRWINDLQISGVFEGNENTEYFLLPNGGELWVNSEKPVWEGYESDILADRGLPGKYYVITDGNWTDQYHQSDDGWQKNALYTGKRLAADYQAIYTLTYTTKGYVGKVVYRGEVSKEEAPETDRRTVFVIKAIVRYRLMGED